MTQENNPVFAMRFVATDRGVKAEDRVKGRIAFPSSRDTQPKPGETWRVQIAGENPRKTVYFLTLVERVEAKVKQPAAVASGDNVRVARPAKPLAPVAPAAAAAVIGAKIFVADYIFAPGGDTIAQAKAWLNPVTKIDLTNLKFAHAQKLGAADAEACEIAAHMSAAIAYLGDTDSNSDALRAKLKNAGRDGEAASELFAARKRSAAAVEAKRVLQLDTLSYGRLKQSYSKAGKADDAEANSHLAVVKGDLDLRRVAVNEEVEAAKDALSSAETGRYFAYSEAEVDACVAILEQLDAAEASRAQTVESIKTNLRFYEDRIDALRKSAS